MALEKLQSPNGRNHAPNEVVLSARSSVLLPGPSAK